MYEEAVAGWYEALLQPESQAPVGQALAQQAPAGQTPVGQQGEAAAAGPEAPDPADQAPDPSGGLV